MTHTATPWRACGDGSCGCGKIFSEAADCPVLTLEDGAWGDEWWTATINADGKPEARRNFSQYGELPDGAREANARFILTACNHHEEAVKLLNECFDELGGMDGQADRRARIYAVLASIKESQA